MNGFFVEIYSHGQTGADRAALDWAIVPDIPQGGWYPNGRKSEDGQIDNCYQLRQTPRTTYIQRSDWNTIEFSGTVIFSMITILAGGSKKTVEFAIKRRLFMLLFSNSGLVCSSEMALRCFIADYGIRVFNVAGPRASTGAEVDEFVTAVLDNLFDV